MEMSHLYHKPMRIRENATVEVIEMKCEAKLAYTSASLGAPEFELDEDEDM